MTCSDGVSWSPIPRFLGQVRRIRVATPMQRTIDVRRRFDFAKDLSMKSLSHETHTESVWRLSFPHCQIHSEFLRGTTPSRLKNLPCPPAPPLDGRGRGMHVSTTPTPIAHGLVCQPNGRRLPPKHTPESSSPREKAHTLYPPSPLTRPPLHFCLVSPRPGNEAQLPPQATCVVNFTGLT